jgi:hypothetical protein
MCGDLFAKKTVEIVARLWLILLIGANEMVTAVRRSGRAVAIHAALDSAALVMLMVVMVRVVL